MSGSFQQAPLCAGNLPHCIFSPQGQAETSLSVLPWCSAGASHMILYYLSLQFLLFCLLTAVLQSFIHSKNQSEQLCRCGKKAIFEIGSRIVVTSQETVVGLDYCDGYVPTQLILWFYSSASNHRKLRKANIFRNLLLRDLSPGFLMMASNILTVIDVWKHTVMPEQTLKL